ncbi:hypothetical protein B0J13DRAFT_681352 [Dactylonectria estremocensis]|uniref:BZIP domain-containing protein n=1 Tax=Dactylonectria estremocensis TaxID=1079267 RepID=A0A9P9DAG1_9HYPO|nr:hypothetical protein B0J13DRAFT_681352 [Dactylonectria estremocensis]
MRQESEKQKLEKREKNRIAQRNHRKREAEKKRQYEKKIVELEAKMDRLAEAARRNDLADMISILQGDAESATAVVCRRPTIELGTPLYTAAAPLALPPPPPPPPAMTTTTDLATLLAPNKATASPEPDGWLNIFEPVPEPEPTLGFASSYPVEDEFEWLAPPVYGSDYMPAFSSYPSHPFQYQIPDGAFSREDEILPSAGNGLQNARKALLAVSDLELAAMMNEVVQRSTQLLFGLGMHNKPRLPCCCNASHIADFIMLIYLERVYPTPRMMTKAQVCTPYRILVVMLKLAYKFANDGATSYLRTITSCDPEATSCSITSGPPVVTTETIAVRTTVVSTAETRVDDDARPSSPTHPNINISASSQMTDEDHPAAPTSSYDIPNVLPRCINTFLYHAGPPNE